MLPQYKPYLNAVALKQVIRPIDTPSVYLGVSPYEALENIEQQQFTLTRLELMPSVDSSVNPDTYWGLPGYGTMVPDPEYNFGDPYFGDPLGGF